MQERDLTELFREAAEVAPEATFDENDVARASRRVTARRRIGAVGGSTAVLAVLVTGVGFGAGWFEPEVSTRADPPPSASAPEGPEPRSGGADEAPTMLSVPGGGTSSECGPPDQRLAGELSEELPEVSEASAPVAAADCPPEAKTASFQLSRGQASGNVAVVLSPAAAAPDGGDAELERKDDGGVEVTVRASSGRELTLRSSPDSGGPAPYAGQLRDIAERLAGEL
ncbi:hypothetical protein [Actinopolyspora saharensis]|uniref:hypothetical protein n=1 Tax=Actinopolyspora saharensis TaxID=995062 RepID=UPI003F681F0C